MVQIWPFGGHLLCFFQSNLFYQLVSVIRGYQLISEVISQYCAVPACTAWYRLLSAGTWSPALDALDSDFRLPSPDWSAPGETVTTARSERARLSTVGVQPQPRMLKSPSPSPSHVQSSGCTAAAAARRLTGASPRTGSFLFTMISPLRLERSRLMVFHTFSWMGSLLLHGGERIR